MKNLSNMLCYHVSNFSNSVSFPFVDGKDLNIPSSLLHFFLKNFNLVAAGTSTSRIPKNNYLITERRISPDVNCKLQNF